jgi:hypothetical protein
VLARPASFRFAVAALAVVLGGCTTTRYVTPWFRTSVTPPGPQLIAESGGNITHRTTEELFEGTWVELKHATTDAMAIDDGLFVIYRADQGYMLLDHAGHARPIDCSGVLRASPRVRALDCIEFGRRIDLDPLRVVWRHFRENSELLGEYRIELDGLSTEWRLAPEFIGFAETGSPLVSLRDRDVLEGNAARRCALYAVAPDRLVPVDAYDAPSAPPCGDVGFWRSRGIRVVEGNTPSE